MATVKKIKKAQNGSTVVQNGETVIKEEDWESGLQIKEI